MSTLDLLNITAPITDSPDNDRDQFVIGRLEQVDAIPNFNNPIVSEYILGGAQPDAGTALQAAKAYQSSSSEAQIVMQKLAEKSMKDFEIRPRDYGAATNLEVATVLFNDTSDATVRSVEAMRNDPELDLETEYYRRVYRNDANLARMGDAPSTPQIERLLSDFRYKTLVADSRFSRFSNALINGFAGTLQSAQKGGEALLLQAYDAELASIQAVSSAIDFYSGVPTERLPTIEAYREGVRDLYRDTIKSEYRPYISSGDNVFENLSSSLGGMGAFVVAHMLSPHLALGMIATTSHKSIASSLGDMSPAQALAMSAVLTPLSYYVNKLGFDELTSISAPKVGSGAFGFITIAGESITRKFSAEYVAEAASALVDYSAYVVGGYVTGDGRKDISFTTALSNANKSGLYGGTSAALLGLAYIRSTVNAQKKAAALTALYNDICSIFQELYASEGEQGLLKGLEAFGDLREKEGLNKTVTVNTTSAKNRGAKAAEALRSAAGLSVAEFKDLVDRDADIEVDADRLLYEDAKLRASSGEAPSSKTSQESNAGRAAIMHDAFTYIKGDVQDEAVINAIIAKVSAEYAARGQEAPESVLNEVRAALEVPVESRGESTTNNLRDVLVRALAEPVQESISDLARPTPDAPEVASVLESTRKALDVMVEMGTKEQSSVLDATAPIAALRQRLTEITGKPLYVSSVMQVVKVMLTHLAKEAGVDPVVYAETVSLSTVLNSTAVDAIVNSAMDMMTAEAKLTGAADVKKADRERRKAEAEKRAQDLERRALRLEKIAAMGEGAVASVAKMLGLQGPLGGLVQSAKDTVAGLRLQAVKERRAALRKDATGKPTLQYRSLVQRIPERAFTLAAGTDAEAFSTTMTDWFQAWMSLARTDAPELFASFEKLAGGALFDNVGKPTEALDSMSKRFASYLVDGKNLPDTLYGGLKIYKEFIQGVVAEVGEKLDPQFVGLLDAVFLGDEKLRVAQEAQGVKDSILNRLNPDNPDKPELEKRERRARRTAEEIIKERIVKEYLRVAPEVKKAIVEAARAEVAELPYAKILLEIKDLGLVDLVKLRNPDTTDLMGTVEDITGFAEAIERHYPGKDFLEVLQILRSNPTPARLSFDLARERLQKHLLDVLDALPEDVAVDAVNNGESEVLLDALQVAIARELNKKEQNRQDALHKEAVTASIRSAAREAILRMPFSMAVSPRTHVAAFKRALMKYRDAQAKGQTENAAKHLNDARMHQTIIMESIKARDLAKKIKRDYKRLGYVKALLNPEIVQAEYGVMVQAIISKYFNSKIKSSIERLEFPPSSLGVVDLKEDIPSWIIELKGGDGRGSKSLTYRQILELKDAIKQIIAVGKSVQTDVQKEKFGDTNAQRVESIARMQRLPESADASTSRKGILSGIKRFVNKFVTFNTVTESLLFIADGGGALAGKGEGPLVAKWRATQKAVADGKSIEATVAKLMQPHLKSFIDSVSGRFSELLPVLGDAKHQWDPTTLFMVLMNTGNPGNLKAISEGNGISVERINAIKNALTKEEGEALQAVGDAIGTLFPQSSSVMYRTRGVRPEAIALLPAQFTNYSQKGWYFPLAYERAAGGSGKFFSSLFKPALNNDPGYLKSRIDMKGAAKPVQLDISVLTNLVTNEANFIGTAEILQQWDKLINDSDWSKTFIDRVGLDAYEALVLNLRHIANPTAILVDRGNPLKKTLDWTKNAGVTAALGFKFVSGLKQRLDISTSFFQMCLRNNTSWVDNLSAMKDVLVAMPIKNQLGLFTEVTTNAAGEPLVNGKRVDPKTLDPIQFMFWKSSFIRSQNQELDQRIQSMAGRILEPTAGIDFMGKRLDMNTFRSMSFGFLRANDLWTRGISWNAQYTLSVSGRGTFSLEGLTPAQIDAKAVADADAIALNMSSQSIADLTEAQRNEWARLFTPFMAAQVRKLSRARNLVTAWKDGSIDSKTMAAGLALEAYGPIIAAYFGNFLFDSIFGESEEERRRRKRKDASQITAYASGILGTPVLAAMDTLPLLNLASAYFQGYGSNVVAIDSFFTAANDARKAGKAIYVGDLPEAAKQSAIAAGYFTGIPVKNVANQVKNGLQSFGSSDKNMRK